MSGWSFSPFTIWDMMYFRFNGGCYRDIVNFPDVRMILPITEPYFHCEYGMMLPLVVSLMGLAVFYEAMCTMGLGKYRGK